MKERKYPFSLFLIGFITNIIFRCFWIFVPGVILLIVGIFVNWCLYAGLILLAVDIIISFIEQIRIRQAMLSDSDNEQFRKFQAEVSKEGNVFDNIRSIVENTFEDSEEMHRKDFVFDMCDTVCKKCDYGNDVENLNEHERVFFVTQMLEQEVNNGGFSQFFCNSIGDLSNETVDAFKNIGALKTAEICKKALIVFNGKAPDDRDERRKMLDNSDCDAVLSECDSDFYAYEDDLEVLNYSYIMKYREFFD